MYPFNSRRAYQKCRLDDWGYNGGIIRGFLYFGQVSINIAPPTKDPLAPFNLLFLDSARDGFIRTIRKDQVAFDTSGLFYGEQFFHSYQEAAPRPLCGLNGTLLKREIPLR